MTTHTAFDLARFTRATEERDARALLEAYAEDAEVRIVDRNNPPRTPQVLKGREAIRPWLEDTYSRDMTHHVVDPVVGGDRVALTTLCRYPDGTNVHCACTAELSDGLITRQTVVQVWDE
ncbi:nuclear transport factor 2 family protein [Citricoccus sp. SGAir0253]|uniref:nuclear transport factor 2 family protein n=1 Tax=Citricoccus sp. SGAir0253 TaxID=2567881 RepID=UPI0010CD03AB|nr:nuclear transport factor 2 family protein [Citricoccus sp. SGAir0253]QCU78250.1 nuclear transport factor 2 family protein [Citricoccus sp. SGAir0253]